MKKTAQKLLKKMYLMIDNVIYYVNTICVCMTIKNESIKFIIYHVENNILLHCLLYMKHKDHLVKPHN